MKRLLERQIRKHLSFLTSEEFKKLEPFFNAVEEAYDYSESDRRLMEHSLDISSKELLEINESLRKNAEEKQKVLDTLFDSINKLEEGRSKDTFQEIDVQNITEYLEKLIDENIKNQEKLEYNQKYLSSIISNIWEWICVIDEQMNISLINTTWENLFAVKSKNIIWKSFLDELRFYRLSDDTSIKDKVLSFLEKRQVETIFDDVCIKGYSSKIPVSIVISPIKSYSDTMIHGWIIVFRDKTKEQELENIKSEFLAIASHELRTPMTVINGFSSLLLEDKIGTINEQQRQYLLRIKNNTTHLINLVNDMLTLSKLESGNMRYDYQTFDLWELVLDILGAFALNAEEKKISLTGDTNTLMIHSDRNKLDQVLINLVGNALKFTQDWGQISIQVQENTTDKTITVVIKDNGPGIKEQDAEKLFSKFYQVSQHLERKNTGTGLWLSICKNIITQMKGTIGVKSEFWKGSEFYFTIPKVHL